MKRPIKLDITTIITATGTGRLISSSSSVIGDLTLFSYSSQEIMASKTVMITKILLITG